MGRNSVYSARVSVLYALRTPAAIQETAQSTHARALEGTIWSVQNKIFWALVIFLGLIADFTLPLLWGFVATIPIIFISWWIVYRSDWF
jgi:hypothetical protein